MRARLARNPRGRAFDRFLDLAGRVGLNVILCTPTCDPPAWRFAKHPTARQLDPRDQPHRGHRHHCNYNHPGARQYRHHPTLAGWQIDNELTGGESGSRQFAYDYHPLTPRQYRRRLKTKHGTLAALNAAWFPNFWSYRYPAWDEIDPPRGDRAMWGWHALLADRGHRVEYVPDATRAQVFPVSLVLDGKPRGVTGFGAGFFDSRGRIRGGPGFDAQTIHKLGALDCDLGALYHTAHPSAKRRGRAWVRDHTAL